MQIGEGWAILQSLPLSRRWALLDWSRGMGNSVSPLMGVTKLLLVNLCHLLVKYKVTSRVTSMIAQRSVINTFICHFVAFGAPDTLSQSRATYAHGITHSSEKLDPRTTDRQLANTVFFLGPSKPFPSIVVRHPDPC